MFCYDRFACFISALSNRAAMHKNYDFLRSRFDTVKSNFRYFATSLLQKEKVRPMNKKIALPH